MKVIHATFGFQNFPTLALHAEVMMIWWWVKWSWGGHNVVSLVIMIVLCGCWPTSCLTDSILVYQWWTLSAQLLGSASYCWIWLGQRFEPYVIQNKGGPTVMPQKQLHHLLHCKPLPKTHKLHSFSAVNPVLFWAISHMKIYGACVYKSTQKIETVDRHNEGLLWILGILGNSECTFI